MNRTEVLEAAKGCVQGDRDHDYGGPEKSFSCIARMWEAYIQYAKDTEIDISESDVAAMMAMLKLSRIAVNPKKADSWVDLAGYAACGGEIATAPTCDDIFKEADELSEKYCDGNGLQCDRCPVRTECKSFEEVRNIYNAIALKVAIEKQGFKPKEAE